jgi:hypothetical protein
VEHYIESNGIRVLRNCTERKAIGKDGDNFRCGYKCIFDSTKNENKECDYDCNEKENYKEENGICIFNEANNKDDESGSSNINLWIMIIV